MSVSYTHLDVYKRQVLNGARENLSLKILAKLIFESGDIDRASKYMKNAMEDAILCNARINTIEASDTVSYTHLELINY